VDSPLPILVSGLSSPDVSYGVPRAVGAPRLSPFPSLVDFFVGAQVKTRSLSHRSIFALAATSFVVFSTGRFSLCPRTPFFLPFL